MRGEWVLPSGARFLGSLLLVFCLCESCSAIVDAFGVHGLPLHQQGHILMEEKDNAHLPDTSPNGAPRPFVPLLAPSPLAPFSNGVVPKLSGLCPLNFSTAESLIRTTAVDCWTTFAPFLANVICCPQLQATLVILVGQSSKETGLLALDATHANHCLSDVQQILESQGANTGLQHICSVHPSNLTEGACPVNDVNVVESAVDSSKLLVACKRVDSVNECCSQICQNAILEAARKIALRDGSLPSMDGARMLPEHLSKIDDCKNIILRWLASRLDLSSAKQVLRRISNCNVNKVCPLVFPDAKSVAKDCGDVIGNRTDCCNAVENYVSHLQKQSFITNLQALDCAAQFGLQLQQMNISTNVYSLCHITLKDFSLQVGSQDATYDQFSGISFTCDLNDNIAAPWPSTSQPSSSSCNKSVNLPALPAATSAQTAGKLGSHEKLALLIPSFLIAEWFL
uniref:Putative GPI-anchored protein At1g61900 n=1 Tax=Anthurium amnicola TaxID=1678845 RepID=A0A1D1YFV6_9ARAE